jgi:hypothetical protein
MSSAATLSGLGLDLSVSISFNIASEFLSAAREAQLGDDELVAVLIGIVVALTSLSGVVSARIERANTVAFGKANALAEADAKSKGLTEEDKNALVSSMMREFKASRGALEFASLMLSIAQRISLSIAVQVLAFSVKSNQPSRIVRVTTLLGVVVFFLFFESAVARRVG